MKKNLLFSFLLIFSSSTAFCAEGFHEAEAVEFKGSACRLGGEASSSGRIQFIFGEHGDESHFQIRYDGVALAPEQRYAIVTYKIKLTTMFDFRNDTYRFDGADELGEKGYVRGHYRNAEDFEVTAYLNAECPEYRLLPSPEVEFQYTADESFYSYE